jgi:hypothetical protein
MKPKTKKNTQALYLFNVMRIAGVVIVPNTSIIVLLRMTTPLYALLGACLPSKLCTNVNKMGMSFM